MFHHHPPDDPNQVCGPVLITEGPETVRVGVQSLERTEDLDATTWFRCQGCGLEFGVLDFEDEEE